MPSDFSLLDHLGIQVPAVTHAPLSASQRAPREDTASRIFCPREKPPPPTRAQHSSVVRSRAVIQAYTPPRGGAVPACVPTDEVRIEQKEGRTIEYQIWNSNIPSNWAYNAEQAKLRAAKKHEHQAAHQDPTDGAFTFEDHQPQLSADAKRQERDAQQRDLDMRYAQKKQEAERLKALERQEASRLAAEVAAAQKAEAEEKRRRQQEFGATQTRLLEEARRAKLREKELARGHKEENEGLLIGVSATPEETKLQQTKANQVALSQMWRRQLEDKKARRAEEREEEKKLFAKAVDVARGDEERELHSRAQERLLAQQALRQFSEKKEQEAVQKHNEKAAERRAALEEERARQAEREKEAAKIQQQRNSFMADIQRQMQERQRILLDHRNHDRAVERGNAALEAGSQQDVLLRCPVTKRLLPPSHFNIPLSQRPQPVRRSASLAQ